MAGQPIFLILTSSAPLTLPAEDFKPAVLARYEKEDWIKTTQKDGRTVVRPNGFVGCLPIAGNKRIIIPPNGLNLEDNTSIYRLISFMIDVFSYYEDGHTTFGSNRSSLHPLMDILPRDSLVSLFRHEIERLPEFPTANFVRREATGWTVKGRLRSTTLYKALFVNPNAGIKCSYPCRSTDSPENQLIKLTISELLKNRLGPLEEKDKSFFNRSIAHLAGVTSPSISTFRQPELKNVNPRYKQILALCNIILWKFSFSFARDVVTLGIPIIKPDYNVFEHLVRAAFRKTFEYADTTPFVVSSRTDTTFNPDLILPDGTRASHLVLDMKFKRVNYEQHGVQNKADLYQIISHSLAVKEASSLGLVYPKMDQMPEMINVLMFDKLIPKRAVTAIWMNQDQLFEFVTSRAPSPGFSKMLEDLVKELRRVQDKLNPSKIAA